jgi:hypothetical protein
MICIDSQNVSQNFAKHLLFRAYFFLRGGPHFEDSGGSLPAPLTPGLEDLLAEKVNSYFTVYFTTLREATRM